MWMLLERDDVVLFNDEVLRVKYRERIRWEEPDESEVGQEAGRFIAVRRMLPTMPESCEVCPVVKKWCHKNNKYGGDSCLRVLRTAMRNGEKGWKKRLSEGALQWLRGEYEYLVKGEAVLMAAFCGEVLDFVETGVQQSALFSHRAEIGAKKAGLSDERV